MWSRWRFCSEQSFKIQVSSTVNIRIVNAWPPESLQGTESIEDCPGGFMDGPGSGLYHSTHLFLSSPWLQTDCFSGLSICILNPFSALLYWLCVLDSRNWTTWAPLPSGFQLGSGEVPAGECKQEEREVEVSITSLLRTLSRIPGSGCIFLQPQLLLGSPCPVVPALAGVQKHCSFHSGYFNSFLESLAAFPSLMGSLNLAHSSVNHPFLSLSSVKSFVYVIYFLLKRWHIVDWFTFIPFQIPMYDVMGDFVEFFFHQKGYKWPL